jgi:hypothetical protein
MTQSIVVTDEKAKNTVCAVVHPASSGDGIGRTAYMSSQR